MIVQHLRDIQNRFGYLPDAELARLARETGVPLYRFEEVASFFPAFRQEHDKPAFLEVRVCRDMTCHLRGAGDWLADDGLKELAARLSKPGAEVRVQGVSCLGRCDRAPAVWVERQPMPAGEHGWVFAGRNRAAIEQVMTRLATQADAPTPDPDADYRPPTNPGWVIDPYAADNRPPEYRAVKRVVEFFAERVARGQPALPVAPADGDLDVFVEANFAPLAEMKAAGVLGMGGAGAPAYGKWRDVWREPGTEKYVVCNGDESEPGTFKDRELLLRTPHLVVEGVILAGLLTGAAEGFIYIRHEYPEQIHVIEAEIARATKLGACGPDVFGSGIAFPVSVFESPGGYICGEQSALIEAMEDRRGQPRNRPPELLTNGLRDKPTVVNNVETLAWAPFALLRGGAEYATRGWSPAFAGRRLFSVSGDVNRPGVYEVPIGIPLGELIDSQQYCGGVVGGKALKAVAPSGPSGGLMPAKIPVRVPGPDDYEKWVADSVARLRTDADKNLLTGFIRQHLPAGATHLDLRAVHLDLNFFRNLNAVFRLPAEAMLGAGIAVYAEGTDVLDQAVVFTRFYRNESCGKCVPCRLGSQKLFQLGTDLLAKRDAGELTRAEVFGTTKDDPACAAADVKLLNETLQQTSICGLGYVAPIPLNSVLAYFPADVLTRPR